MAEIITSAQMRAIEEAAIGRGSVTGLALMERAGQGVVEAAFEEWPELAGVPQVESSAGEYLQKDERAGAFRAVVLCGPGNNGGDGFVVARLLAERGWEVDVFLFGDPENLPPDARVNYDRWSAQGPVQDMLWEQLKEVVFECALVVEALFGIGLRRGLRGELWHELYHSFNDRCRMGLPTVAVDIPAGVVADTGEVLGGAFEALLTVTFHRAKLGHYLGRGALDCGKLVVCDIGLGKGGLRDAAVLLTEASPGLSFLDKLGCDHKFDHGHALVLSGPPGKGGAARLAARGALRIGAGLVTVGCPRQAVAEHAAQLNAIMVEAFEGSAGLRGILEDTRINALCLGPGLGRSEQSAEVTACGLEGRRATVLDADALSSFQGKPQALFDMLHDRCVLTPHAGEFARLFPDIAEALKASASEGESYSKVDAARAAAARAGCVVLFKGADTVIADPNGRCSINASLYERAAPWLATAGAGDVLAGMIVGLLARGYPPMQAAETASWLHSEAARSFGPGLIAEDLPEQLPAALRALLA